MDPQARHDVELNEEDIVTEDEHGLIDGYTREELMALLQEAEDSGPSDKSWDELITELNLKYFGKEKLG